MMKAIGIFRLKKKDFKFFHIILVFNILVPLICSVTISSIIYSKLNQTLDAQNKEFMHYAASQALNGIENIMKNCELTAKNIYSDSTVSALFQGKYHGDVDYTLFTRFMSINSIFENYSTTNNDIKSIVLYKIDPMLITDGKNVRAIESFKRQDLMKKAIEARGKDVWVTYDEDGEGTKIVLLKYINVNLPGGVLAIEMNQERLSSLYKGEENVKYLLYVLSGGEAVFSSNPQVRIGRTALNTVLLQAEKAEQDRTLSKLKQGDDFYYFNNGAINDALSIVVLYDAYELEKEKRSVAKYVWACTCFFVLIGVLLAVVFSTRFARNIEQLVNKMKHIEKGNLRIKPDRNRVREISALDQTLCSMALTIEDLTENIARTERQKAESEIKYLQKQMNPHFLYNLLSAVKWIAFHKQEHKIAGIIDLLSDFYKMVLSQGKEIIPLRSEIKLIENYAALQNLCHSNEIALTVRSGTEHEHLPLCKMTIQPFIENSIVHGKVHGKILHITVDVRQEGDRYVITITDDGMGVNSSFIEYIGNLNKGELPARTMGYGVTNTFMRLRLLYGDAGIRVYPASPGTVVEISFSVSDRPRLDA